MRRPGGYATITSPAPQTVRFDRLRCEAIPAGTYECDTFSCAHCSGIVHVAHGTRDDEYFCRNCMARICSPCADHPCVPFLKKIEAAERRAFYLRQYGG